MAIEIELKLQGPPGALDKLKRWPVLRRQAEGRARTVHQKTTYFDSGKGTLAKSGIAVRIREQGKQRLQTVKWPQALNGTPVLRHEEETSLTGNALEPHLIADGKIRQLVEALVIKDRLNPLFVTDITRMSMLLVPKPGTKIELCWDSGAIKHAGQGDGPSQSVSELELELKQGSLDDLFSLAEDIVRAAPLRLSLGTKAERGYALIGGQIDRPVRASLLKLEPGEPAPGAVAKILAHAVSQMLANEGAILRDRNPEGVHQMRVALRRLRSAISAFKALLDPTRLAALKPEIAWLTKTLGLTRDLDVFQESILSPVEQSFQGDLELAQLAGTARTEKRKAWEALHEALKSERYRLLVLRLMAFVAAMESKVPDRIGAGNGIRDPRKSPDSESAHEPNTRPIVDELRKHLTRRLKKVTKLGKAIEELSIPQRHELRIQLKKLRYLADFGQSCFPRPAVTRYLKHLSTLQDLFGQLNDAAVAEDMVDRLLAAHNEHSAELSRASGLVVGWHRAMSVALWHGARKAWRRFSKTKPFWQ